MKNRICYVFFITAIVWSSAAIAQNSATQDSVTQDAAETKTQVQEEDVPVAEMPTERFFKSKEFWYPNRFNVAESLSDASIHYRKGALRAAKTEIEEAVTWLRIVKANADDTSKADIETVITDLNEVATQLDGEKSVSAKKLNRAFANANLALARHHFSKANKLVEQADLMNASRRLVAAADHMKNAAYTANVAPSPIVGMFRDEYSPYGMVNEKLELTPEQLQGDLEKLALALKKLGEKMQDKAGE